MEFTGERYIPTQKSDDELSVEHLHRYNSILPFVKNKKVLDIACGEGYGSAIIADHALEVIGVDISEDCIINAREKYRGVNFDNISFKQGDIRSIPVEDNSIDVIVTFETIEHVNAEAQKIFLKETKRVLKADGILIISTPNIANYSLRYGHTNDFHVHELSKEEFVTALSSFYKNVHLLEQGFDIVSTLLPEDYYEVNELRLINWQDAANPRNGKYLVGVASDVSIDISKGASVVVQTDKDYLKQIDRILELQEQVEERSKWGLSLDKQTREYEIVIKTLREQINDSNVNALRPLMEKIEEFQEALSAVNYKQELERLTADLALSKTEAKLLAERLDQSQHVIKTQAAEADLRKAQYKSLESQFEELQALKSSKIVLLDLNKDLEEKSNQLETKLELAVQELKDKEKLLQDLNFNFSLTRQQLGDVNNELVTIYGSDGWKALKRYYNFKGKYLSENSAHYKALRKIYRFVRNRKDAGVTPSGFQQPVQNINQVQRQLTKEPIERTIPYFESPTVSIIIPTYNGWEHNERCINSIIEHTTDVIYEIILADDCSTDYTRDISKYFKNIVHVRNETNQGFLLNCNNAAKKAKGKFLHFLNNDTEVKAGWLSSLLRLMEKEETIGMAGSKLIYPDGRLQEAGGIIWNDASGWNYGNSQDPNLPEFNYVKEVDYISGASILIRKKLWDRIGGFDKRYIPAYCEDSDLAFEVRKQGYKVIYQPLSVVTHFEGATHGSQSKEYQLVNNRKFFEKWESVLTAEQFENGHEVFYARDRSAGKRTILVVDHYVPHFDKDAGSKTVFAYLKLFVSLNFNVKFIGDNFYRHEPYTTVLQQMGIEVLYGPWFSDNWQDWVKVNRDKLDYVLLNRPHISVKYIDAVRKNTNAKILYYGHDLHFMRELKQYEIQKDPMLLESSAKWKVIELSLFNKSDVVLAPSEAEKYLIEGLGVSSSVFAVKPYIFDHLPPHVSNFGARRDILFVGGFTHKPNVDAVLWFLREVWPIIKEGIGDVRFIIAGSNVPPEISVLAAPDIDIKGFVSDDRLKELYETCKVAVVPLRFGAGVKGKTVEALFHGLPLVTTDFGVEGLPGKVDFLVAMNSNEEFAKEVVRLYKLPDQELSDISKVYVEYIQEHFHATTVKNELLDILDMVSRSRKPTNV